jgi:hypothetical protein
MYLGPLNLEVEKDLQFRERVATTMILQQQALELATLKEDMARLKIQNRHLETRNMSLIGRLAFPSSRHWVSEEQGELDSASNVESKATESTSLNFTPIPHGTPGKQMAEAPTRPPSTEPALPLDVHEVSSALLEDGTYSPVKLHYPSDTPVESAANQWVEPQAEPKGDEADKLLKEALSPFSAGLGMSDATKALNLVNLPKEELQRERHKYYESKYVEYRKNLGSPSPVRPLPEGHAPLYLPAPTPESPEPSTVEPLVEDISPFSEEGAQMSDITKALHLATLPKESIQKEKCKYDEPKYDRFKENLEEVEEMSRTDRITYWLTLSKSDRERAKDVYYDFEYSKFQKKYPKKADPSIVDVVQCPPPKTAEDS